MEFSMIERNYRFVKKLKPYIVVLTLALMILFSFPALSISRSKRQITGDRFQDAQTYDRTIRQRHRDSFNLTDKYWFYYFSHGRGVYPLLSKNYRNRYDGLSPEEKTMLQKRYREWESLPEEKRQILRRRMKKYEELPLQERERYQHRYRQFQKLPSDERYRIREKLRRWDSLSPEEQEHIRQRFRNP